MDRALDLDRLGGALGGFDRLPTPEELRAQLADVEVALFSQQPSLSRELIETGWYLHGIASADPRYEVFPVAQQRRAWQVSAHIFDLALAAGVRSRAERLRLAFAAQI